MALGWLTENGWPSCAYEDCDTSVVPGTGVSIPVQIGIPNTILKAFLADLHAYVEPYNGQGDWGGWTPTNSVATSNHLGGTAVDFNWNDHPIGPEAENPAAGWQGSSLINGDEVPAVRDLLNFYEGMVFWGNDWDTPKDSMHFQMGYDTYNNIPKCMDFIRRKIGPGMFSTYRRDAPTPAPAPQPAPTPAPVVTGPDPIDVLVRATGLDSAKATEILATMRQGLTLARCNNINRIAMFIAQTQEESDNYNTTQEYGDLSGEAFYPFIGRTWIQITWQSNYAAFGTWCVQQGLITDPNQFVNDPGSLADMQWAGIGAAWYWTVQRPGINGLCDNGDIVGVTQAINGGTNGLDVRTANWNRALGVGNDLLALITSQGDEDEMAGWTPDLVARAMVLLENQTGVMRPSRSGFRWPGEGPVDTCGGFAWAADGNEHMDLTIKLAEYGDPDALALLLTVSQITDPDRTKDAKLASLVLAKIKPTTAQIQEATAHVQSWLDAEKANQK